MSILESKEKLIEESNFFIFLPIDRKIKPIRFNSEVNLDDLQEISDQKEIVLKNTLSFIKNKPSNNILLWGAKGMGKSTLVKCTVDFINTNLNKKIKLIEVLNNSINNLVEIIYELSNLKSKFIIFIDDISFRNNDEDFKLLKSLIEGSLLSQASNIKYYITSNLRHLSHNNVVVAQNDIQQKESNQNLISLSDRFGCWIGFYDSDQEKYIKMIKYYLKKKFIKYDEKIEKKALQWSIQKGSFSGRTASQFVNLLIS